MKQRNSTKRNEHMRDLQGFCSSGRSSLRFGGGAMLSNIAGNGTFAETAARIVASERLYRMALSSVVIVTLSSALLAFALYVTLKAVNSLLAQLGMIFSLGDSFLALVVRMCSFVRLYLYISARGAGAGSITGEPLSDLIRTIAGATENIGGISFGHRLVLFLLFILQIKVYPEGHLGARLGCLSNLDGPVFCQFSFPGTSCIVPVHLFSTNGPC